MGCGASVDSRDASPSGAAGPAPVVENAVLELPPADDDVVLKPANIVMPPALKPLASFPASPVNGSVSKGADDCTADGEQAGVGVPAPTAPAEEEDRIEQFSPAFEREASQPPDSATTNAEPSGRYSLNGAASLAAAASKRSSGSGAAGRLVLYEAQANPALSASIDPAVTPSAAAGTVSFLGRGKAAVALASEPSRHRYFANETDLSVDKSQVKPAAEDSDEDELEAMFSMQAWKRFYGYNQKKPQELLSYFWRKYNPNDYSCYCVSYRYQGLLTAVYQAENLVNGFCARLELAGLMQQLFGQIYVLYDFEVDTYSVVGMLVMQGSDLLPGVVHLSQFDNFVYSRADMNDTLVRQFVSALLVQRPPLNMLQVMHHRQVL